MKNKILYIEYNSDGTVGGSHFSLLYLVEGIDKSKFEPVVVFYQQNWLIPRYIEAGCRVILQKKPSPLDFLKLLGIDKNHASAMALRFLFPLLLMQKFINYLITFLYPIVECYKILRREGADIVHLNNTLLRPQEWIVASTLWGARVVAHERGINEKFSRQSRILFRCLDAVVCISSAVQDNLVKNGFKKDKLHKIYNGLDPQAFVPVQSRHTVMHELGLSEEHPIIGIIGNIKRWKGQEIVIKAMVRVKERFPDVKCLLVGRISDRRDDREFLTYLNNIIENHGLSENIVFTGERRDPASFINVFDILIHSSIAPEPFGRVILEGMALEKPVITNSIGAGPEIVVDGSTGMIVGPGDENSLADAIIFLLSNPEIAVEMGKAGRKRLENVFHASIYVKHVEELYKRVLEPEAIQH